MTLPVEVGELIRVHESDYCYGLGDLVLRVTQVWRSPTNTLWLLIKGIELAWNGQQLGERQVCVRASALENGSGRDVRL